MTRVLDGRNAPFCWQEKDVIRLLKTYSQKKEALAIYITLTLIASDTGSDEIQEYGIALQDESGVGRDSMRLILNQMLDDGIIDMKRLPATRNKVYGKLSIKLLSRKICKVHGIQCKLQCRSPSKKQSSIEDNISKDIFKEKIYSLENISLYGEPMLGKFFNYRSETKNGKGKMKREKQETWELEGRLRTWLKNQKEWKQQNVSNALTEEKDYSEGLAQFNS